ncbi:hypothetical protein EI94DRAFT_1701149 [Lactarius quietus]|nr:hypothetical protein EI94DRAFT_1701149 [Lactarius quietus]
MDFPYQFPGQFDQCKYDGTRDRSLSTSGGFGGYGTDTSSIVAAVLEQALQQNGFYLRLQYTSNKQQEEITALRKKVSKLKQENTALTERNKTFCCARRGRLNWTPYILHGKPPPKPILKEQTANPNVKLWQEDDYKQEARAKKKGETDGNASAIMTKRKPGCPPNSSTNNDDHSKHFYLEHEDGTPVSRGRIKALSIKARMTWEELLSCKLAPTTFCKMMKIAWEFYWYSMAAYPEFSFILLCKGGEWKLRQWSIDLYSSWTCNRGLRGAKPTTREQTAQDLNDPNLLKMDPKSDTNNDEESSPLDDNDDNTPYLEDIDGMRVTRFL